MSKFIAVTLALAFATLANSAHAEFRWERFGADPYAASRNEAMQTRESAFRAMDLPESVITELLRVTEKPGEKVRITMGNRFSAQVSKGGVVHRNVVVAWSLPVRGMEYAAPAEKWQVSWEGKTFTVILPEICFNWSANVPPPPLQKPAVAATVTCTKEFFTLYAHVWSCKALPGELCKKAEEFIKAAEDRDTKNATDASAYKPHDVSRSMYADLVLEPTAPVDIKVRVQILDPQTLEVREDLGEIDVVAGVGSVSLTEAQRAQIVQTIWPENFRSPTISGGKRRLWLFDEEWKRPGGGNWCIKHVSGLIP